ncbi:MAG: lipid-A-disaccharide synthase [Flavobacteriales bacterium]
MTEKDRHRRPQRIYILTGEPSGEAHAARVVDALRAEWPNVEVRGMGGDAMEKAGVELVEHVSNTAIMGFAEVLSRLGFIRKLFARVQADILAFRPDRILIVDYPGFNLRMAKWARGQEIPVDMYIGPQVWAWKRKRVHAMARDLDRLSVILPFEPASYTGLDLDVHYVGHPLLDRKAIPAPTPSESASWKMAHGLPPDAQILALLPGSRPQEIQRMLPVFLEAANRQSELVPVIAGAPGRSPRDYPTEVPVLFGQTSALYRHAQAGLVTSGTATLEAALAGMPQVVAYRTSTLTYALARAFSRVRFISLVNLILDREAVPERIQGSCTAGILAHTLEDILSPEGAAEHRAHQDRLRAALGSAGASEKVARSLMRPLALA